jgi:hypothetical protein
MAHFAEINENNQVIQVLVTDNDFPNEGYDWLIETFGGRWVKTSYNAKIRGKFAGIGDIYDESLDLFLPPKPNNGKLYEWDVASHLWKEVNNG